MIGFVLEIYRTSNNFKKQTLLFKLLLMLLEKKNRILCAEHAFTIYGSVFPFRLLFILCCNTKWFLSQICSKFKLLSCDKAIVEKETYHYVHLNWFSCCLLSVACCYIQKANSFSWCLKYSFGVIDQLSGCCVERFDCCDLVVFIESAFDDRLRVALILIIYQRKHWSFFILLCLLSHWIHSD